MGETLRFVDDGFLNFLISQGAVTTLTTKFEREKAQAKGELHKAMVFTKQELAGECFEQFSDRAVKWNSCIKQSQCSLT